MATALVLAVGGYALKDRAIEEWYLHRLNAGVNLPTVAERLLELRSVRGVAFFLTQTATCFPEEIGGTGSAWEWTKEDQQVMAACANALNVSTLIPPDEFTGMLVSVLDDASLDSTARAMSAALIAKQAVGFPPKRALNAIVRGLETNDKLVRDNCAAALRRIEKRGQDRILALERALREDDQSSPVPLDGVEIVQEVRDAATR